MAPSERRNRGVVFVRTLGSGSMDRYSQKLAEHLPVEMLDTDIYERSAEFKNIGLMSRASLRGFAIDGRFVRRVRKLGERPVHLPNHHLARYGNFMGAPYVVTVHDLIRHFDAEGARVFIHSPNRRDRLCLRLDYLGMRMAAAIISVSETTRRDLVRLFSIPEERISVVHEGVDHDVFRPRDPRRLDFPYVLFVGSEHPRKNLATLLRAFAALKRDWRFHDLKLVKVGAAGGREAPFREETLAVVRGLGLEREVVFTERIGDDELVAYYSGACCLVLSSLYEGFGFPPLEAMACGCPAIVSTAGALPEVTGGAGLTVDPEDVVALARAMAAVLDDDGLRRELRGRGLARAREFSWQRAAGETVRVYEVLAGLRERRRDWPRAPARTGPVPALEPRR
ncbi:MAG: glycosyltransferase family 4 protein [Actinomycetota bacterium]|nr:glycosyltransferase family 4 protein [Actinomycetota bacterium]